MRQVERPNGTTHFYTLKPSENYVWCCGLLVVVHPDRAPKYVHEDGTEEEIKPDEDAYY